MENRIGLPWVYVRRYKGSFGQQIEDIMHFDFDGYSKPRMDSGEHFIFSLKNNGEDVCMIRCKGQKARQYALDKVNLLLDEKEAA